MQINGTLSTNASNFLNKAVHRIWTSEVFVSCFPLDTIVLIPHKRVLDFDSTLVPRPKTFRKGRKKVARIETGKSGRPKSEEKRMRKSLTNIYDTGALVTEMQSHEENLDASTAHEENFDASTDYEENLDAFTVQNLEDLGNGSTDNFDIGDDYDFGECSSIVSNFSFVLQDIPNENSVDHSDSVDYSDQEDLDFMEELNYLFECEEVSI